MSGAVSVSLLVTTRPSLENAAVDVRIESLHGRVAKEIESLALRDAFLVRDVEKDHVAKLLGGGPMGTGGTDVSCADDADLRASHDVCSLRGSRG